jgi:hypothetical protein
MGSMSIAVLEMTLPRGNEADTIAALHLRAARLCRQGVFQEVGAPATALYIEMRRGAAQLEAHIRSGEYHRLLAIMETAAERPALRFNFVLETRGLAWVEQLRLGSTSVAGEGES